MCSSLQVTGLTGTGVVSTFMSEPLWISNAYLLALSTLVQWRPFDMIMVNVTIC